MVKHLLDSMTGDLTTVLGNDLGVFAFPPMVRRIAAAAQQHSQLSVLCGDGQEGWTCL